jgi:hypothetical protein
MERGASLDGWIGKTALELSFEYNMESMAEMLLGYGVVLEDSD